MEVQRAAEESVEVVTNSKVRYGEGEHQSDKEADTAESRGERGEGIVLENVSHGVHTKLKIPAHSSRQVEQKHDESGAQHDGPHARHAAVLELLVVARSVVVAVVGHAHHRHHADEARRPVHDLHGLVDVVVADELLDNDHHHTDHRQDGHHGHVAKRVHR